MANDVAHGLPVSGLLAESPADGLLGAPIGLGIGELQKKNLHTTGLPCILSVFSFFYVLSPDFR